MAKFEFIKNEIEGLVVIKPTVFGDDRGFFMETFHKEEFAAAGITREFVQDNHSKKFKRRSAWSPFPDRKYTGQTCARNQRRSF